MKIILHLGAHCTDGDHLLRCMRRNEAKLAEQGIMVPDPSRYRPVIREAMKTLKDAEVSSEAQELILDAILTEDEADRVVLSQETFLGFPKWVMNKNMFYPVAGSRAPRLRALFASCEVEFFLGLRNPATFIPEVYSRFDDLEFDDFLNGCDPMQLRWSGLVARLRKAVPDAPVTVWCNEDTPMIWDELLQFLTNHDEHTQLDGLYDFVGSMMSRAGRQRLQKYIEDHPPRNAAQRQRVLSAFLEKFALAGALEQEVDLPGWSDSYIEALSALYDEDCALLSKMDGVRFVTL